MRRLPIGTRVVLSIVAVVATVLLVFGAPSPASAQFGTEDPTATTLPGTETTVADPSATTATTAAAGDAVEPEANVPGASEDSGGSTDTRTSRRLLAIIGGLLGIGLVIMVLTVLYWRHTKPSRQASAEPEWIEGEGWVAPHESDEPDPVKMQRKLQRHRRRREDRAAAPVGEWFAEPDPTLDPFAPEAPSVVPVVPSGAPAPPPAVRAPGPAARPRPSAPPAAAAAGAGAPDQRRPRPAANGAPAQGAPTNGRPPQRRQAPPGTQPQRVAKKRAPAPSRQAPAAQRPPAARQRPPAAPQQGEPRPARPAPQGEPAPRRRAPQGARPAPGADPSGQVRRPRPRPAPVAEDWEAQTDELAEFWQEMRNKDA